MPSPRGLTLYCYWRIILLTQVPDCILNPEVVGKKKLKRHPIHHGMSGSRSMAGTNFSASKKQDDDDSDSDQGI